MATAGNISNINLPDGNKYDIRATAIPYGTVDSTSTATAFTATVHGITALTDGTIVALKNGVVTSASGFTINVNGLGAKPCYSNMATGNPVTPTDPTRDTTIFNINYVMIFVYSTTIVEGGGWICYRGYDANTNTIGYQLRTNSQSLPMKSVTYRYRLLFTSADGKGFVPANNSTSTNATSSRTVCQDKIDPFGPIYYYGTTASVASGSRPSATYLWNQYTLSLGYSFNRTGSALTLTSWRPVYVKCAPQTDGSAIIDSTTPYVQTLPSTDDGKIYIFLGVAYSATNIEFVPHHPVYYFKDGAIRLWTDQVTSGSSVSPYTSNPAMDGTASAGSSNDYARGDHVHPSDTSRVPVSVTDEYSATGTIDNTGGQIQLGNYQTVSGINNYSYVEVRPSSSSLYASSINTTTGDYVENELEVTATETTIHNVVTPVNNGDAANKKYVDDSVATKQDTLVSGTNIKTVNNNSLLGNGNVSVGTITGITMNGVSKGTSGIVDLGTVVTSDKVKLITVTITSIDPVIVGVSDTTSADILTATNAGKLCVVKTSLGTTVMTAPLSLVSATADDGAVAIFTYEDQSNSTYKYCTMTIIGTSVRFDFKDGYATTSEVATKQDALVSGTNIKTINNISLLGSGNVSVQPTLVSGTNIKTINNTSLLGSGNINIQDCFIITETYDLDEDIEVVDKTYAEILAAYNSGKRIYLVDNSTVGMIQSYNLTLIAQLTKYDADNGVFIFECNTGDYTHQIYSIDSNDELNTVPKNYINRASVTSGTKYGLTLSALNSDAPNFYNNSTANLTYDWSSTGSVNTLSLGSEYGSATGVNVQGKIQLYGTTEYGVTIDSGAPTANRNITFPDKSGTVALTSDCQSSITTIRRWTSGE